MTCSTTRNFHLQRLSVLVSITLLMVMRTHAQTYQPNWASLDKREVPGWWSDAKFGIFVHWGVYSVPAYAPVSQADGVYEKYSEHYESRLLTKNPLFTKFHNRYFGEKTTYQDFAPQFKAEYFDPDQWADLFARSGAKYVVLTSKHHDGFCLWPSPQSPKWNSQDIGPHRDLIADLSSSVIKKGLHMGLYYSLLEWTHPLYNAKTIDEYVDRHMLPQMKDLVSRYKPEVIFSDGEWDYQSKDLKSEQFLAWLYNESPVRNTVVVNDRWGKETRSKHGGYYTTEYDLVHDKSGIGNSSHPWEESRGIGTSYGYNRFETTADYYTSKQLIDLLIDKVSAGGNLLLDVGPEANGLIPVIMQERLLDMGAWLKVNGEAIYHTTRWEKKSSQPGPSSVYFTRNGKTLYALCKKWPDKPLKISGIRKAGKVSMLGLSDPVRSSVTNGTLSIVPPSVLPDRVPCQYAWVFKIENIE
ncbi:alpha-L-fucosidase [Arcticibacter sp. MXS-1]|uniref:alpha-L-fucosidase n=1 Tax=Arcticibacter sp. MXS-1 TaxID=3341726 RepID=UPI0035A8858C